MSAAVNTVMVTIEDDQIYHRCEFWLFLWRGRLEGCMARTFPAGDAYFTKITEYKI
jgi:hypothetical protein